MGKGGWTFTARLNAAINDIAPVSATEFYMTQFLDAPASLEGGASGALEGFVPAAEEPLTATLRFLSKRLGVEYHARLFLPRLRRTHIWHCYCAVPPDAERCARTVCEIAARPSTTWNGIAFKAASPISGGPTGFLYVTDIFRRLVVEFAVLGSGAAAQLEARREFWTPYMVDNVHVSTHAGSNSLWVGAVGYSEVHIWGALTALQKNASAAYSAARAAERAPPRPHLHLRPTATATPQPPMPSGALHIDLATGKVTTRLLQSGHLAAVSWSHLVAGKLVMGSPWDDGVLVCPD